jgi:hypothetical protein
LIPLLASTGASAAEAGKSVWDRIHPSGDMRLRYEWDGGRFSGLDSRHRARARFRLGAKFDVTDELLAAFRVRTGNADIPNSPHQTFGNHFDSWEIAIDRAYLRWEPDWAKGGWVEGGKMPDRFKTNPVYSELVWDSDINPEGGQLGYDWRREGLALGATTGIWLLNLFNAETAKVFPIQGYGEYKINDDLKVTAVVGYHGYYDMGAGFANNQISYALGALNRRNVVDVSGNFVSDFRILDTFGTITYAGLPVTLTVVGEYIYNAGARNAADTGWAVGANGKTTIRGYKFVFTYQYQSIEADALFTPMAQDDFQLLASNFTGHIAGIDWGITKGVMIRTWALFQERIVGSDGTHNKRVRVDLNVKF